MKKYSGFILITLLAAVFFSCKSYTLKFLDKQKAAGAKTALVIDMDFFPAQAGTGNGFNLKCENMSGEECGEVMNRLKTIEEKARPELMAYLARLTRSALTAKGMPDAGLDKKAFFDSKQFPIEYSGDKYTWCGVSRDYRELLDKGYTHVLYAGFPNRVIYKKNGNRPPALYFGVEMFMVDIRPGAGDMNSRDNRIDRQILCYHISPSMQKSSDTYYSNSYKTVGPHVYLQTTTTTVTIQFRQCLGIALVRRNGTPYSTDELFSGTSPLYLELYRRAAVYGLGFAARHMSGKFVPDEEVKINAEAEDFITKIKLPPGY